MTQYTIRIRDLKAHLSSYLEKLQKGHTIIITSHSNPTREELMDRVKVVQEAGLIIWNGKRLKPSKPVVINKSDKLASDLVIEMNNVSLY